LLFHLLTLTHAHGAQHATPHNTHTGDAFAAFRTYTTTTSPRGNRTRAFADRGEGEYDVTVDFYSTQAWFGVPLAFEARAGRAYEESGVPGANVFAEDAVAAIAALEADVRGLPGFPGVCARKPEHRNYTGAPVVAHCDRVFSVSPLDLARPSNVTVLVPPLTRCCSCDGSAPPASSASSAPACFKQSALCEEDAAATNRLVLRVPDGEGAVGQTATVMAQLHSALSCDSPALGGARRLEYFVDANFETSPAAAPASATTRGYMRLGGVVDLTEVADATPAELAAGVTTESKRWKHIESQYDDVIFQRQRAFILNELIPLFEAFNSQADADSPVRAAAFSGVHLEYEIVVKGILVSAMWSLPAFASVVMYMWFHTRSPFLTFMGLAHVLVSFPTTWAIYYLVFQIKYMGFLNFIALFVIMGIGADDIFVFTDAWKQSRLEPEEISGSVLTRLQWTYKRAAGAMLVTSITDACAFYANCISDITVIRIFGAFVGTMYVRPSGLAAVVCCCCCLLLLLLLLFVGQGGGGGHPLTSARMCFIIFPDSSLRLSTGSWSTLYCASRTFLPSW
jgi:hypothetical protein